MVQFKRGRQSPWMVQVRDLKGDLLTHSFRLKSDAEDFERMERRKKQLSKAGMEAPRDEIILIDYVKGWLTKRSTGKQSSFSGDESRLRLYWLEVYGIYPLQTITTAMIKERLDYIQFELKHSPADRNRHRALMHKLFQDAFMDDKVALNPVSRIPLVPETIRRKSGTLEPADQAKYVAAMYAEGPHYGILADIMLWTGARIMSAAALQWRDIDFQTGTVRLCRIVERASGTVQDRTKGGGEGGEELIPLLPVLRDRLLTHRKQTDYIRPTDYVAAVPSTGSFMPYESHRKALARVLKATGIARFTPHAIKKAFATNAKRAGLTNAEIKEMFGHSSEQVTARYNLKDISHLIERTQSLRFGSNSVSRMSTKTGKANRTPSVTKRRKQS